MRFSVCGGRVTTFHGKRDPFCPTKRGTPFTGVPQYGHLGSTTTFLRALSFYLLRVWARNISAPNFGWCKSDPIFVHTDTWNNLPLTKMLQNLRGTIPRVQEPLCTTWGGMAGDPLANRTQAAPAGIARHLRGVQADCSGDWTWGGSSEQPNGPTTKFVPSTPALYSYSKNPLVDTPFG